MFDENVINSENNRYFNNNSLNSNKNLNKRLEEPCSLQNQFVHYYRYGRRPDCSSKWKDFLWCLRTKSQDEELEQKMLLEKRLERLERLKKGRNSEEIWSLNV
ncbi:hypothetical protein MERGE_003193 [Pneumocystis wakefieldiae]|uniref:Uncharacterized protein n=1 Tax=Pneumocystis wakefieldiae TaxID=38082 RepID=A0A899FZT0_9ASCO|nr:hypothetical protein MERGE_003193 [Pneumocystis wakefieldiae]